ncbi:MAG: DUF1674 domain-containing protein [Inquilinus sp.]|nr:DUF1674 domain-containing protein [Inquilinus sp.]
MTEHKPDSGRRVSEVPKPEPSPARGGASGPPQKPGEIGGRDGPEPTRYGDWEVNGRCTDF